MTRRLWLKRSDHEMIVACAQNADPNECCGLLVGGEVADGWRVTEVHESQNVTVSDPKTSFEIDPRLLLTQQRSLRGTQNSIIGLYHSHPNGAAAPSPTDRRQAWQPGWLWIIVGVSGDEDSVLRAFLHAANGAQDMAEFVEVPVRAV